MLGVINDNSKIYFDSFFGRNKNQLFKKLNAFMIQEGVRGSSNKWFCVTHYYLAFYLVYLLDIKYKQSNYTNWIDFLISTEIDFSCIIKFLKCSKINLNDILSIFGYEPITQAVLDGIGIETDYYIENPLSVPNLPLVTTLTSIPLNGQLTIFLPNIL